MPGHTDVLLPGVTNTERTAHPRKVSFDWVTDGVGLVVVVADAVVDVVGDTDTVVVRDVVGDTEAVAVVLAVGV